MIDGQRNHSLVIVLGTSTSSLAVIWLKRVLREEEDRLESLSHYGGIDMPKLICPNCGCSSRATDLGFVDMRDGDVAHLMKCDDCGSLGGPEWFATQDDSVVAKWLIRLMGRDWVERNVPEISVSSGRFVVGEAEVS